MCKRIVAIGVLMTALTVLVFLGRQVAAEPDANAGATTGESSPSSDLRAKIAAGPNANATLSLDLIPNGGSGNQRNDAVTSGTVSGQGTKIAIEVFATGVTTALVGMQIGFDFDATLLTFDKAENSAFTLPIRASTGTDFAATPPVTLLSSGFLTRAEFTTATNVTGREFSIGIASVTLSESSSSSDTLTTTNRIEFNATTARTPDFDGNGTVGFSDFMAFAEQYRSRRGDGRYQVRYDLNRDGAIDFSDFLIFIGSYDGPVSPPGGGSSRPDLIVESPSVSDSTLTPGQSFTLRATVRNSGTGSAAATTLRYYRSSNSTISASDTEVGKDSVSGLSASNTSAESISLRAPSSAGMYYYGACVASVSGESNSDNNCSDGVRVTVSSGSGGGTPKMYWTDQGRPTPKIQRANFDGSNVEDLITTGLVGPLGIALDVGRGKMYWTDWSTYKIQRANLDGSNVEDLITTGLRRPTGIALDVGRGKMYWTDEWTEKIQRANLDGSNVEDLITTGLDEPRGIALDVGRGKMYWTDNGTEEKIQRANLDGSNVEDLITTGLDEPRGIALDVGRGKMYWTDNGTEEKIQRANLDGSNVEDLITTGLRRPVGIALDVGRGKMYWTDLGTGKIQRANLDGSNVEDLITTGLSRPEGIALDVGRGKMYWTDLGTGKIQRANLDGSNVEDLITIGLSDPYGIALDVGRGKMYWTDDGTDKIQRANLDGSNVEDLITTGLDWPVGIALDVGRGKMYWTDEWTNKIQRANLDGSNVEDLITTGLRRPQGIALDVGRGKMYWTDDGTDKIQRANLDGSNVEDLITTGLRRPNSIALDVGRGKMYWTDRITAKIQRANLDGSNVEDLITTGLRRPTGIALDVGRGKMYWTDEWTYKIQRANLDGSNVEDLITTGLRRPTGIALDTSGSISSGGGGSSRPDLIVQSPSVSDNTLTTGQSFTLSATVRNSGTGSAAATTLRYYRSSNSSISTSDTQVGTDSVSGLSASGTSAESISLRAPSSAGTYYYGACVASVSDESNSNNNCSTGVRVTVSSGSGGGGSSRPDLIVQSPSVSDNTLTTGQSFTLRATVRNSGTGRSASTTLRYYRSSNSTISTSNTQVGTDNVSGLSASATSSESISLTAPSSSGTYYYGACVASVSGESNTGNNCSTGVRVTVSGSTPPPPPTGSLGACSAGMVVRPNQSCSIGGGEFRNVGGGCFVYIPFSSIRICVGSLNVNGFRVTRVGNDYRIDAVP